MRSWEKNIRKVVPYVPGERPKGNHLIKLNTNENPYPPSPRVKNALREMEYDLFRKYPDPAATMLTDALAETYHVAPEQIFVGVGSDDVIAMAFMTFFHSEKPILFPDITYSFYKVWAQLFEIPYETPKLDQDFQIQKEDYYRENGGIIFPNPNAPTGLLRPLEWVEDILKHNQDSVVIVDEAYIDFGGESALPLLEKYENLLIVQTFSKSRSMAGMRIGFAIGHPDLIRALQDVKYSYNSYTMNLPSQILGTEMLKDEAYFKENVEKIIQIREYSKKRLRELGFEFPDSYANFIFAKHPNCSAEEIFAELKKRQVYVRYFKQDRLSEYLRISIGTDQEMETLFGYLGEILRSKGIL